MSSVDTSCLLPELRPWFSFLLMAAQYFDPTATLTSACRSYEKQAQLYADSLAGRSPYPAARPGSSMHERGRAIDIAATPEVLAALGHWWESVGGRWGGRFSQPDPVHFEA